MKKILLPMLLIAEAFACQSVIAPCIWIEPGNEKLMVHEYYEEDAREPQSLAYFRPELWELVRPLIGVPYVYGGNDKSGIDCSSFTRSIYKNLGIYLPRTSRSQYWDDRFEKVSLDNLQAWDLVYFKKSPKSAISHVAIYLGEGKIAHSAKKEGGVTVSAFSPASYWKEIAYAAKRLKGEYR